MNRSLFTRLLVLSVLAIGVVPAPLLHGQQVDDGSAPEFTWPQQIVVPEGKIVVYQPTFESYSGDRAAARAAVSVTPAGAKSPIFGAMWFDTRIETDVETRMIIFKEVKVTAAKFPNQKQSMIDKAKAIIEAEIPKWNLQVTRDDMIAAMELVEKERELSADLRNDPPKILFRTKPTVLVLLDGAPELRSVPNSSYKRVVNTPYALFQNAAGTYFVRTGQFWHSTTDLLTGTWTVVQNPPGELNDLVTSEQAGETAEEELGGIEKGVIPEIAVSTEPAELLLIDGEPQFATVEGTNLLYVQNTENNLFKDISTQTNYILFSGRWYKSSSVEGPWSYVPHESLPPDFAKIPKSAPPAEVLASVPGTTESKEAILDAQIPQTAEVKRSDAKLTVTYDGEPQFVKADNVDVFYAVNTSTAVFLVGTAYYACDNGVWFAAAAPAGPWTVCDKIPDVIYSIPPSCPHYNVKYTYVYDSTPEVVYVGYTPGYTGCYVVGSTVVYGTGYYYPGWYGPVVIAPRPVTWGFNFGYNPWSGWSMGVTIGGPHFTMSVGGGYGGWWGPPVYRPPYRPPYAYRPGYYRPPYYRPPAYRPPTGARPTPYSSRPANTNVYNRRPSAGVRPSTGGPGVPAAGYTRPGTTPTTRPSTRPATSPSARPSNNVYTDKAGNVYRDNNGKWQQQTGKGWQSADRAAKPAQQPTFNQKDLDRQAQSRQRSVDRSATARSYQQGRPQASPSSQGRSRGGGRRR